MLFRQVTSHIHHLDQSHRQRAHLASVLVSNFVNAINATAQNLMQEDGLDFDMLRPLAEQTLRKWDFGDLWSQQTGPAARRDEKTLTAQRRLLASQPELLRIYYEITSLIEKHT